MSTGAILLAAGTFIVFSDTVVAVYIRSLADRVESGEIVRANMNPDETRKVAAILLYGSVPIWIVCALIAFGVIPSGIDTIKF